MADKVQIANRKCVLKQTSSGEGEKTPSPLQSRQRCAAERSAAESSPISLPSTETPAPLGSLRSARAKMLPKTERASQKGKARCREVTSRCREVTSHSNVFWVAICQRKRCEQHNSACAHINLPKKTRIPLVCTLHSDTQRPSPFFFDAPLNFPIRFFWPPRIKIQQFSKLLGAPNPLAVNLGCHKVVSCDNTHHIMGVVDHHKVAQTHCAEHAKHSRQRGVDMNRVGT